MKILQIFRNWWWARQRATDLQILWPQCLAHAKSIDHARAAFAAHAFRDRAWFEFYGHDKLVEVIGELPTETSCTT